MVRAMAVAPGISAAAAQKRLYSGDGVAIGINSIGGWNDTMGVTAGARPAVTVTAAGSADTKGSYTEIVASTAHDADAYLVRCENSFSSNAETCQLMDIAVGAAASEVVIAANLMSGWAPAATQGAPIYLVPSVPPGSRLSARMQAGVASQTCDVAVRPVTMGGMRVTTMHTVGADTADSGGLTVTDPGDVDTEAAWTEVSSSWPATTDLLIVTPTATDDWGWGAVEVSFDIGVGGAGSEVVVLDNYEWRINSNESLNTFSAMVAAPVRIVKGARVAVRFMRGAALNINDFNVVLYALEVAPV